MSLKTILIGLLILWSTYRVSGQDFIRGFISDHNGPLPGVTVQIEGTTKGTITNPDGSFLIDEIMMDKFTLIIRSVGYKTVKNEITISTSQDLSIKLEENNLDLNEVVVTGTMTPTSVSASPIKIDVISFEHLNTYLPTAASSIVESIQMVNGVQEVVACGVCFTNSISINGLPGAYTAILMDGSPIYGSLASVYGLNGIPNMIIDRFEVIKGPSSTLYGSEAVAGVINIITKNPENEPIVSIDMMGTSHMESFGNIAIAPRLNRWNGYIGYNYAYISDYDDDNKDGFGDMINLDRHSIFTKWNLKRADNRIFSIATKLYYEDRRNGVKEYVIDRNYRDLRGHAEIYGESIYTYRAEIFGTYDLPLKEAIKLDYSLSYHDQNSYYGSDFYDAEQRILFTNLLWNKQISSHQVLAGISNRLQFYDDNTIATEINRSSKIKNKPDQQYIPGLILQDEWTPFNAFTLLSGIRVDHYKLHGPILSPRLNVKIKPANWTTIRTNFGTGFRVVNLFAEDHAFVTGQREVVLKDELNPEKSYNGSINLNHVFTLGRSQGMIDVDGYWTHFTNKIIPDYEEPGKIIYANSTGSSTTKGIGMNFTQEFDFPFSWNAGLNFQKVTQMEKGVNDKKVERKVEYAPSWTGMISANYKLAKPELVIAYTAQFTGPMTLPEVFDINMNGHLNEKSRATTSIPFSVHNLQLSKTINKSWGLYFGIQNLFNYKQKISPLVGFNDPNSQPGFSQYFDTAYAYSPIHGREFYVGIKWSLAD